MISVVIPLYNKEESIKKMLTSVLNQKFKHFEVLIINDGSTDKSVDVIKQYFTDKRIKIINKINEGVSSTRNLGIKEAKYEWIAFIDADDYWNKKHLENIVDVIANKKNQGFISTGFYESSINFLNKKKYSAKKEGLQNYFDVSIEKGFPVHTSSVCIKKEILKIDNFDINLTLGEDNELFSRLGKKYKVYFIKEPTSYYFYGTENQSTKKKHDYTKDYLYKVNLNQSNISKNERIYYIIFIIFHLYKFLIRDKNYNNFFRLLKQNLLKFKLYDFYNYIKFILKK